MKPSKEHIRDIILQIVDEMLKEWGIDDEEVAGTTLFSADLGLSSVDALQMAATLDLRLGTKLPYQKLLGPSAEYPTDMTVDQLVDFAYNHFGEVPEGPIAM